MYSKDKGSVIIEASFVFPIMFLVIAILIFTGNAYLQKAELEAIVVDETVKGVAKIKDPLLGEVKEGKGLEFKARNLEPYRYLLGEGNKVAEEVNTNINKRISGKTLGLFGGIKKDQTSVNTELKNNFINSKLISTAIIKVKSPYWIFGEDQIIFRLNSDIVVGVHDVPEFIRNAKFGKDMLDRFGLGKHLDQAKGKIITAATCANNFMHKNFECNLFGDDKE
ncbi:TadE/TadG family type IV pilus assembly protein [Helcococcus kunzii]|uniref:TadE-like protein n=1 Tax=Helcococcus kunzii ATCC 51366 TaxID=883114 RepID=H3NPV6_9FIRM|nr:TadE family protein [Helcococcus kunzii]EHR33334.1 hypothetical protein HMPREF9709_01378 [Helcococcus kunzii ATCC 51366]MCT1795990.1 pilus assembly protein [Helcococcus kunzii]MCT1988234.1 pilus assembly protein [Helcococcus kunzii]QUY65273.1 pilus assembly protein [Helcococcus kunzii]QZO75927.1 pilus assembly protein [Helcococcus kunzii]